MKWMLVLYFIGLGGQAPALTSIGPYESRDGCFAVGQLAAKDGLRGFCYPVGDVPLKKPEPSAEKKPEPEAPKKK
jgi:hypothetical protein